jgi:hypothetical protein
MLRRRTSLKAAVLRAALEDQKLAEPYRKLAQHYGLLVHPCRPRSPQHKGIAEDGGLADALCHLAAHLGRSDDRYQK